MTASGGLLVSADLTGVSLTAEQTLALYGTDIPVSLYGGTSTYTGHLVYSGRTTADIKSLTGMTTGDVTAGYVLFRDYDAGYFVPPAAVLSTNFLIYEMQLDANIPAVGSYDYQLQIDYPLQIETAALQHAFFWTCENGISSHSRMYGDYVSSYTVYGSDTTDVLGSFNALGNVNSDVRVRYGYFSTYPRPVATSDDGVYYDNIAAATIFAGATCNVGSVSDDAANITVSREIVQIKGLAKRNVPIYLDLSTGEYTYSPNERVYVLVGCPVLYGDYQLPDTGSNGVDLSRIEDYLNDMNIESNVHTSQLIAILAKLEQIYQAMQQQGGYNPVLTTASGLTQYDYSAQFSQVDGAAPTESDVNNMTPAISGMQSVYTEVVSAGGVAVYFWGLVSIAAAGWFIMRGRG